MKCLYCGKRLALLRKLTDSEFCTDAHRHAYQREQEQMALARLSDAHRGKKKGQPEVAPVPEPSDEPQFVEWKHRVRDWKGLREVETEAIAADPVQFFPERSVVLEAWPAPAGRTELPAHEGKAKEPARLAQEPAPAPTASEIVRPQAAAGPVSMPGMAGYWKELPAPEPAIVDCPAPGLTAEGPLAGGPKAVLPAFAGSTLTSMPAVAAMERQEVAVQLAALEGALESHCARPERPARKPLPAPKGKGRQRAQAKDSPKLNGLSHETDAATAATVAELVALLRPEAKPGKRGGRRIRPRELFFPLPRLGDLSSTASQLGVRNIAISGAPGTEGAQWKPGAVAVEFETDIVDSKSGRGTEAFGYCEAELNRLRMLPVFERQPQANAGVPIGGRLDDVSLFLAGDGAKDSAIRAAGELEAASMGTAPAKPILWVGLPEPALSRTMDLDPLQPDAAGLRQDGRQVAYAAVELKSRASLPAAHAGETWQCRGMAALPAMVEIAVTAAEAFAGMRRRQLEATPEIKAQPLDVTMPKSRMGGIGEPEFCTKLVPVSAGKGVPYPENTVAIQDLSPIWPEPDCMAPVSKNQLVEDSAMREAVQAMSLLLLEENRSFLGRLRLPLSRADLKWFVMSVPAILLLSLYLLTNKDSRPDLAQLANLPAMEDTAETTEPMEAASETAAPTPSPKAPPKAASKKRAVVAEKAQPKQTVAVVPAKAEEGFLDNVRQTILQRAAVNLSDDFRSGLGDWEGEGEWSRQWSYDAAGFLHTGSLILYKPSLGLTDYRMEFLGRIEKKSMGWAYRAADAKNYYAHKITLTRGGPLPVAVIERYAVIQGKTYSLARRPLPMQVQEDSSYRVRMDVRGNGFTLTVQGQVVDHWSDDRLKSGGIGFFSARGEQASLRWVEISHQYDFLGRLCAFLAPYSLPAKEGSLKQ